LWAVSVIIQQYVPEAIPLIESNIDPLSHRYVGALKEPDIKTFAEPSELPLQEVSEEFAVPINCEQS
jgi:hypothetical protein